MKKTIAFLMGISIIVCLAACSGKRVDAPVTSQLAKVEAVDLLDATGIVKTNDIKDITLGFPAEIEKVLVKKGQIVKGGEELVQIDMTEFLMKLGSKENELAAARIALQKEQVEIDTLKGKLKEKKNFLNNNSEPGIRRVINDIKNAQEVYEAAVEELSAKQALYDSQAISKNDLDEYNKAVESKKYDVDTLKLNLESLKLSLKREIEQLQTEFDEKTVSVDGVGNVNVLKDEIVAIEKELNMMKESLKKSHLEQNSIVSDVSNGIVYEVNCLNGEAIDPQTKVLRILNLDSLVVEADIFEENIMDVKIGSLVIIKPIADKTREYEGKVVSISSMAVEKNGGTVVPVEISFEDEDRFLMPGFNVDLLIKFTRN